jgi:hypothetical protein
MDNKKAPGEVGITAEIYKQTFKIIPKSITDMYNACLKTESSRRKKFWHHEVQYLDTVLCRFVWHVLYKAATPSKRYQHFIDSVELTKTVGGLAIK